MIAYGGLREIEAPYIMVECSFLERLHVFSGNQLKVLMAIARYVSDGGWSFPSMKTLERTTGLSRAAISSNIATLTEKKVEGEPILHVYRTRRADGYMWRSLYLFWPERPHGPPPMEHSVFKGCSIEGYEEPCKASQVWPTRPGEVDIL